MARFLSKLPKLNFKARCESLVDYVKNVLVDYKTVFIEIGQDMKEAPVKSAFYVSLLTGTVVLLKTNPNVTEFHSRLTESTQDLMLIGELNRNNKSVNMVNKMAKLSSDKQLHCYNLGLFSLMCDTTYGSELGLYEAKCKHVKPHWTEFHKTVMDVGVFGRWIYIEKAMEEYDVNSEEWLEDGQPNKDFKFYSQSLVSWDMKLK